MVLALIAAILCPSCERYLDIAPDQGITDKDVYKNFDSYRGFMDNAYNDLDQWFAYGGYGNSLNHIGTISDELASLYNSTAAAVVNSGNWSGKNIKHMEIGNDLATRTSIARAYEGMRIANRTIADINKVNGITPEQKNELLGQAYFLRAWFYFQLITRYGGMPVLDKYYSGEGDEDKPRKTYHGSHDWMITDIDKAIELLPDAWDDLNTGRPAKISAMAFKEMAQLYDASPLMQNGLDNIVDMGYDRNRCSVAAKSAYDVIRYLDSHPELGYRLASKEEYRNIFYWTYPPYTHPEYLWYNRIQHAPGAGSTNKNDAFIRMMRAFWLPGVYSHGTGNDACAYCAPTQNMVDMFEKRGDDGQFWPITHPNAGYDPQNPYADRDPRFTNNILYPGEKWGSKPKEGDSSEESPMYITLYEKGELYNEAKNTSSTKKRQISGYMCKKFLWEGADQYKWLYSKYRVITCFIRIAQVYLDFAEASFEATLDPYAKVEGCGMSALDALNVIRNRAGIGDLPAALAGDNDYFREALRRERCVELMFENHRWNDLRRWMEAEEVFKGNYPIKGMLAKPQAGTYDRIEDPGNPGKFIVDELTYGNDRMKFTYQVVDMIPEQRVFQKRNYWYPFSMLEIASMNNLQQNPGW